ncbi:hypothetical protein QAD02_016825 [Eretmocerus hayati]|uniref:Uncharacterized protein n=1 Tax=Eretmocerus hayati TaxID=131215 RepID=A0ACC2PC71_9HYME|nr:hypothetical protein QAD02_016825 [Eretmocerus hayati]
MARRSILLESVRRLSTQIVPNVCIVGAGPAGFYAAQQILKSIDSVKVDILERLPVPFGLVRFGVAPDHPEVKNVINTFTKTAKDSRVQFLGNVNVGKDVSVQELRDNYHAVLLTYGAEEDKQLNIPGENLQNVISARSFVGWYNGFPDDRNLNINLDVEDAVILGQGNVAIDVARFLLSPIDRLKNTDITSYSLDRLSQSRIKRVWLVGRRGPLQAAFTIAELRELLRLEKCRTRWRSKDFEGLQEILPQLERPRRRLTDLMLKSLQDTSTNHGEFSKELNPVFLRSPVQIAGSDYVQKVVFSVNKLEGQNLLKQTAKQTDETEEIPCGLVVRSIGYKSVRVDPSLPFDSQFGRVINSSGKIEKNLYAAGWVATGPVGVILSTMTNAFKVGQLLSEEIDTTRKTDGYHGLQEILLQRGVSPVSFQDWEKIDQEECRRGSRCGKPREKIVDILEMMKIARS